MRLIHGDCLDALATLPDCTVDSVVTDPPAGIFFMGKAWDGDRGGRDAWVAWLAERLTECFRVLKPGGHAVVWALPRTSGWTHRALEDAGFEVRDCLTHLFGSGFPKSLDVGKAIDKAAGAEREVIGCAADFARDGHRRKATNHDMDARTVTGFAGETRYGWDRSVTAPATAEAQQWDGWGTALKPSAEFWYLARKPLVGTVAGNVTTWGTGALNIDGCRVGTDPVSTHSRGVNGAFPKRPTESTPEESGRCQWQGDVDTSIVRSGRWPANTVISHDCADECSPGCAAAELDGQSGTLKSGGHRPGQRRVGNGYAMSDGRKTLPATSTYGSLVEANEGGASRFFATFRYVAKPSTREKGCGLDDLPERHLGDDHKSMQDMAIDGKGNPQTRVLARKNHHPTVKPVELMRWLIRLVTPPGGTVLDPFAGSGTTLVAATLEGFDSVGVEAEAEYLPLIEGRVRWAEQQAEQPALSFD